MTDLGDDQDRAEQLDNDTVSDDDDDPEGELDYPPNRPLGVEEYGTTASEERYDEPLEERLRREVPDRFERSDGPDDADLIALELADGDEAGLDEELDDELDRFAPVGRLVDPGAEDDGIDAFDDEPDAVARRVAAGDLSAEEEAVHLTPAPPFRGAAGSGYDDDSADDR